MPLRYSWTGQGSRSGQGTTDATQVLRIRQSPAKQSGTLQNEQAVLESPDSPEFFKVPDGVLMFFKANAEEIVPGVNQDW